MSSERKHCKCGRFAASGQSCCYTCMEIESLEGRLRECRGKLKEYAGPAGRRWRVNISTQHQTFRDHVSARKLAQALLDLGVWYLDLEEVK